MSNCLEVSRNGRLCAGAEEYEKRIAGLEAQLDALMQEYCPDEITVEQWQRIEANIIPATSTESKAIQQALEQDNDA